MRWEWPLLNEEPEVPTGQHHGAFAVRRKHDVHTGVDLYCRPGEVVCAVEDGIVVAVVDFTGTNAGSPWWNDTAAVLIEGKSGVVCYGELVIGKTVAKYQHVYAGESVGQVATVLVRDKGRPMTMLHLELYVAGVTDPVVWHLGEAKPTVLLDPTELLKGAVRR